MELGLHGRVAIVTGSSQGIGKAIALGLAQEGARIVMCARSEAQLQDAAKEIASLTKSQPFPVRADLTKKEDIARLIQETFQRFQRIDVLVNNTGGPPPTTFKETSDKNWQDAVHLLLMSVVHTCGQVILHMQRQNWGRIINMTSFVAKQPADHLILSNTIRAGILGLSKSLSNELAPYGILVNAVCPGWTFTKRVEELAKTQAKSSGKTPKEVIKGWES